MPVLSNDHLWKHGLGCDEEQQGNIQSCHNILISLNLINIHMASLQVASLAPAPPPPLPPPKPLDMSYAGAACYFPTLVSEQEHHVNVLMLSGRYEIFRGVPCMVEA